MRFITMMGTAALSMTAATLAQSITFNEIRTGAGNAEYIELKGTPGASLAGLTIVVLGDGTSTGAVITKTGVVEWLYRFAKTDVIGSNGYLLLHNSGANPNYATNAVPPVPGPDPASGAFPFAIDPAATNLPWGYQTPTGSAGDTQLESPDNMTFLLVSDFTGTDTFQTRAPNSGSGGQDLDTNDDGVLDITPWSAILDSVAFKETNGAVPLAGQDWWYSPTTCGPYITRNVVTATSGTVIAGWDYQTTTNTNGGTAVLAAPATPKTFKSNAGVGTMYLDGTNGSSDWLPTELTGFGGTGINATGTAAGGNGLDPVATGITSLALVNNTANGKAGTFKFSMTGLQGVTLSYATRGTSSGFTTQRWAWSNDATTWTDIEAVGSITTNFALKSLASLTALDGATEAYLRVTFSGSTGSSGNNRLDNVLLLSNPVNTDTIVTSYAGPVMGIKQANGTWFIGVASTTVGQQDTPGSLNYAAPTYTCGDPTAGDCAVAHGNAFCADACCCAYVGGLDPYCVTVRWDAICVTAAAGCAANCTALPCPADFNGDRVVAGADLGMLLGGWGGPDYDLNGDGISDGADLGILLGAWGNCP
jgi:hypothetical protein